MYIFIKHFKENPFITLNRQPEVSIINERDTNNMNIKASIYIVQNVHKIGIWQPNEYSDVLYNF